MSAVSLSANTRTGLSVLQGVSKQMATAQNRLATGKAVNGPMDNATKFFAASSLNARAASLNSLMDSISTARSTVEAASAGVKGVQNLIKDARAIANQAMASSETLAHVTGSVKGLSGSTATSGIAASKTVTVSDGTTTATFTAGASTTVQNFLDAVNNSANLKVEASLTNDGRIQLDATDGSDITVGGTATTTELASIGLTAGTTEGKTNDVRKTLARQFDAIRTQIDKVAADAGFGGTNLLNGDQISVALNEDGAKTNITGVKVDATTLGLSASANDFQANGDITAALDDLVAASDALEAHATAFSANTSMIETRASFNKEMSNILKSGAEQMLAADMNEEAANLIALQSRQQMATTALSITQSADQVALRLFG